MQSFIQATGRAPVVEPAHTQISSGPVDYFTNPWAFRLYVAHSCQIHAGPISGADTCQYLSGICHIVSQFVANSVNLFNIDENNVYEPDVTIQCGSPVDVDETTVSQPTILVEVLSASTKGVDSSDKFIGYFQLSSVEHYLVVDPVRYAVIHHYRTNDGIGTSLLHEGALKLDPPGIDVDISDFFEALKESIG